VALHGMAKCIVRESALMLHGGVAWKACALYSQKLVWLLKDALEALKHSVQHRIPQPPPRRVTPWTDASGLNWGGLGEDGGKVNEIHRPFSHNKRVLYITLKETLAAIYWDYDSQYDWGYDRDYDWYYDSYYDWHYDGGFNYDYDWGYAWDYAWHYDLYYEWAYDWHYEWGYEWDYDWEYDCE